MSVTVQIHVRHRIVTETKSITHCDDCPHRGRLAYVCTLANNRAIGTEGQRMYFSIPEWCPLPGDPNKEDEVLTHTFEY